MNELIEKHLYHRKPNLLLESVVEATQEGIQTSFFLGHDHPLIQGHFPGLPIFPGTQMIEMLVQSAGLHMSEFLYPKHREEKLSVGVFKKCDGVKFQNFGRPGQEINAYVKHLDFLEDLHSYQGEVRDSLGALLMKAKFSLMTIKESTLYAES